MAAKRAAAEEEARRQAARAHGTAVTVQSFMQWKAKHDAQVALVRGWRLAVLQHPWWRSSGSSSTNGGHVGTLVQPWEQGALLDLRTLAAMALDEASGAEPA